MGAESHLRNLNIAVLRQRVPVNFQQLSQVWMSGAWGNRQMLQSDGLVRRMFNMKWLPIEGSYLKAISRDPK